MVVSSSASPLSPEFQRALSHQKKVNSEANDDVRMVKFFLDVFCENDGYKSKEVSGGMIVLKHDKVRLLRFQVRECAGGLFNLLFEKQIEYLYNLQHS